MDLVEVIGAEDQLVRRDIERIMVGRADGGVIGCGLILVGGAAGVTGASIVNDPLVAIDEGPVDPLVTQNFARGPVRDRIPGDPKTVSAEAAGRLGAAKMNQTFADRPVIQPRRGETRGGR